MDRKTYARAYQNRKRSQNREAYNTYMRNWAANNPEKAAAAKKRSMAKARLLKYGLTLETYEALLILQDRKCEICKELFNRTPHIDHDHATGRVRGLLCSNCNTLLGFSGDRPDVLRSAATYLER